MGDIAEMILGRSVLGDTGRMLIVAVRAIVIAGAVACGAVAPVAQGAPPGDPFPASAIDGLPVPIASVPMLGESVDRQQVPTSSSTPGTYPPMSFGACSGVDTAYDDAAVFGAGTLAFQSTRYSGFSNVQVAQAVGVYPDVASAQAVFAKLVDAAKACQASGLTTFTTLDPAALVWQGAAGPAGDAGPTVRADQARLVRNVVVRVDVAQYEKSPQIAADVADRIAAKVTS